MDPSSTVLFMKDPLPLQVGARWTPPPLSLFMKDPLSLEVEGYMDPSYTILIHEGSPPARGWV